MNIEILPSLLAADMGHLESEIKRVAMSGSDALHLDIMDPTFVPNMSYGPDIAALSRRVAPELYRNVHLMMTRPDKYIEVFAAKGAQTIQIHVEADCDKAETLRRINALGCKAAIALNPETPLESLEPYLPFAQEVLVMTVHPGYGGQKFIPECLDKVRALRSRFATLDIMVDGGVNASTAIDSVVAGANQLVSGSFLFKASDMKSEVEALRRSIAEARR